MNIILKNLVKMKGVVLLNCKQTFTNFSPFLILIFVLKCKQTFTIFSNNVILSKNRQIEGRSECKQSFMNFLH